MQLYGPLIKLVGKHDLGYGRMHLFLQPATATKDDIFTNPVYKHSLSISLATTAETAMQKYNFFNLIHKAKKAVPSMILDSTHTIQKSTTVVKD